MVEFHVQAIFLADEEMVFHLFLVHLSRHFYGDQCVKPQVQREQLLESSRFSLKQVNVSETFHL